MRHFHGQHVAPALPVDPDRDQYGLASHCAVFTYLLVTGVQNQTRIGLFQSPACELLQSFIEGLRDPTDGRRTELVPTQLFGNALHLARLYAFYVHLQHRCHQSFFAALIPLEHLRPESPLPVLRYAQLDLAHPRDQHLSVISRTISQPLRTRLILARSVSFCVDVC